mgnify:CR=1 FL=1
MSSVPVPRSDEEQMGRTGMVLLLGFVLAGASIVLAALLAMEALR